MASRETESKSEWLSASVAAEIIGVERHVIPRLASLGRIAVRNLPVRKKYRREDVDRIARESQQPAAV